MKIFAIYFCMLAGSYAAALQDNLMPSVLEGPNINQEVLSETSVKKCGVFNLAIQNTIKTLESQNYTTNFNPSYQESYEGGYADLYNVYYRFVNPEKSEYFAINPYITAVVQKRSSEKGTTIYCVSRFKLTFGLVIEAVKPIPSEPIPGPHGGSSTGG